MKLSILIGIFLLMSCSKQQGRFNYESIKKKMNLSSVQVKSYDRITEDYTNKAKDAWYGNKDKDPKGAEILVNNIWATMDSLLSIELNPDQFAIYETEIKIQREGRDKYSIGLIKKELNLDNEQNKRFDLVNKTFYKALVDEHDNYHGQPDVYRKYYKELDKSRIKALKSILNNEQYAQYQTLAKKYRLGEDED